VVCLRNQRSLNKKEVRFIRSPRGKQWKDSAKLRELICENLRESARKQTKKYFMLVVISNPTPVKNEAAIINQLFDEGLSVFHLRKPECSSQDLVLLLQEINPLHYSKIALHSHHSLAKSFGINRLHYTEASREQITEPDLIIDYQNLSLHFNYVFLSPVFDSISKPGYHQQTFNLSKINKKPSTKLIALGGIDANNCIRALDMGFDGVAVLGTIWKSEKAVVDFKNILQILSKTEIIEW
jgi:thiamine-phosphate pyrophosphorylase